MSFSFCPLFSGSSGNSALISSQTVHFLIDAGLPGKTIANALFLCGHAPERLSGILITHEHMDHIKGAGILSRKYDIPIYANAATWGAMEKTIGKVALKNIRIFQTNHDFYIGDFNILPYAISHDAAEPVGFCIHKNGRKIAQMTDLGHVDQTILDIVQDAQVLLVEANHDIGKLENGPYPRYLKNRIRSRSGHLSNDDSGKVCCKLAERGVRRFILGHLSAENNTEQLAFTSVAHSLLSEGISVGQGKDVELFMAHRDRTCGVFHLK